MGIFTSTDEVAVELEGCRCDGSPHDHDTIWLRADLSPEGGIAATHAIQSGAPDIPTMVGIVGRAYLLHGITRWTFVDEQGQPIPCTTWNIARLDWDIVRPVAEEADKLYGEKLLRPLVDRLNKSSRNGRTVRSTSPRRRTSSPRPKQSRPSTTATTPHLRPLTTNYDGDSSTSPRKRSASG